MKGERTDSICQMTSESEGGKEKKEKEKEKEKKKETEKRSVQRFSFLHFSVHLHEGEKQH
jgi:hypothetical protein